MGDGYRHGGGRKVYAVKHAVNDIIRGYYILVRKRRHPQGPACGQTVHTAVDENGIWKHADAIPLRVGERSFYSKPVRYLETDTV